MQAFTYDGLLYPERLQVNTANQQRTLDISNTWGLEQELKTQNRTDTVNNTSSSKSRTFSYDSELRLTQEQSDTGGLLSTSTEAFTLDAVANRTAHSKTSGTWQYDANNRLLQAGSTNYRYDSQNRLIEVPLGVQEHLN